jgi:hypothetical protein
MALEDPSSHATPGAVRVVHLDWELVVDFVVKVVHGYATVRAMSTRCMTRSLPLCCVGASNRPPQKRPTLKP